MCALAPHTCNVFGLGSSTTAEAPVPLRVHKALLSLAGGGGWCAVGCGGQTAGISGLLHVFVPTQQRLP